jgi:hypothetical protein
MEKHLTKIDVEYLEKKINANSANANSANANSANVEALVKKELVFLNKNSVDKLDIADPDNKQRACIGIAKFYIKIAHLFASIVTTINPMYSYQDDIGNTIQVPLYKKNDIPASKMEKAILHTLGICENRIASLRHQEGDKDGNSDIEKKITVNPTVCSINMNMDGTAKTLVDEPGIPELMYLYYDDLYDYKTGKFMGMSKKTTEDYSRDVKQFYEYFTGNKDMPENIKEFKDIKLREYNKNPYCETPQKASQKYDSDSLNTRRDLFTKYAENIKSMIYKTNKNQEELLTIINKIFAYSLDKDTNKDTNKDRKIRINPELTDSSLQAIVEEARNLIIKLYLTCEMDYTNGIKIYEAIVESTIIHTTENQINNLQQASKNLY